MPVGRRASRLQNNSMEGIGLACAGRAGDHPAINTSLQRGAAAELIREPLQRFFSPLWSKPRRRSVLPRLALGDYHPGKAGC
jgi:hypothetical protein